MGLLSYIFGNSFGNKAFKKLNNDKEYQDLKKRVKELDKELKENDEEMRKIQDELGIPDKFKF